MKQSIIATMIFACTAVLPAQSITYSTPPDKLIVGNKIVDQKMVVLHLANLEKKYTYVSITDMKGESVYFSEAIKNHNGFHRVVNIANLVDGKYLIKVKTDGDVIKQIIRVSGDNAYLSNFKKVKES